MFRDVFINIKDNLGIPFYVIEPFYVKHISMLMKFASFQFHLNFNVFPIIMPLHLLPDFLIEMPAYTHSCIIIINKR